MKKNENLLYGLIMTFMVLSVLWKCIIHPTSTPIHNIELIYTEKKQVYQTLREEDARLQLAIGKAQGLPLFLNEGAIRRHEKIVLQIDNCVRNMREIATSDIKINNDFVTIEEDYQQYKTEWASRLKQAVEQIIASTV